VAFGLVESAQAATAPVRFRIEPKRYAEALLDLAQQANITLIGARACEGTSATGVSGAMRPEQALDQLLADAPCAWRMVAAGTVEITARAPAPSPTPAPPPRPVVVSELVVTATKRARNPRQLAVAVSVAPGSDLETTGGADIAEASPHLAGVLATNLGPGRNKLLLRGLSDGVYTGRTRSTVATYLDDIPLNYNAPDPDLRLVDVERVEVARGPQGALYGAGSLSGVYRIVTRQPELGGLEGEVRATGSLTKGGDPSHAAQAYLNLPVWRDLAAVRVSAYDEVQGGTLDDTRLNRADVDRTERRGGRLSLLLQPVDDWSLTLTAAGQHLRSDDTHYMTLEDGGPQRKNRIAEPHVNDITLVTGTIRGAWKGLDFTSSTGFVRHSYGSFYDADDVKGLYTSFAQTAAYSERNRTRMLVHDTFVARDRGRLEWLAGVYAAGSWANTPSELFAQNTVGGQRVDVLVYSDDRRDRITELAAYGEVAYEVAPRWTVALGGRLFAHNVRTRSAVVSEREPARSFDRERDFQGFSPKISVQYQLGSGDLLYGVVSEGHRAGGINSGGAIALKQELETFAPDRLRHYELGAKLQFFDGRVSLDTAAFYDTWRNIQTDQFRPSGMPVTTNAGDADIAGLESELSFRWNESLFAQLNGRVARIRTGNANLAFAPELVDALPGAPRISGAAVVGYQRELGGEWRLRLAGEAAYVGRSRLSWYRADAPRMGGYVRARLVAELATTHYGLQAFVTNPTNAFGDTFAFGNPFRLASQVTPQRPRTFGLTVFAGF
jgi:outer membrane receptor protein involved in Fe transport